MCVVSMISDYYRPMWPWTPPSTPIPMPQPWTPSPFTPPGSITDTEILKKIRKLLEDAEQIDKSLGHKDCSTTENDKTAVQQQLSEYIARGTPRISPHVSYPQATWGGAGTLGQHLGDASGYGSLGTQWGGYYPTLTDSAATAQQSASNSVKSGCVTIETTTKAAP